MRGSVHSKRATDLILCFGHCSVDDGKPLRSVSLETTSGQICAASCRIHKARGATGAFFFFKLIYLFLAVLGLRFCARAFSSCGKRGSLHRGARASHYHGLSCCGAQAPDAQAQ